MNKILIVDASASDFRVMSSLLSKAGYDPIGVDSIEAGKVEVAKLTVTVMHGSTIRRSSS